MKIDVNCTDEFRNLKIRFIFNLKKNVNIFKDAKKFLLCMEFLLCIVKNKLQCVFV